MWEPFLTKQEFRALHAISKDCKCDFLSFQNVKSDPPKPQPQVTWTYAVPCGLHNGVLPGWGFEFDDPTQPIITCGMRRTSSSDGSSSYKQPVLQYSEAPLLHKAEKIALPSRLSHVLLHSTRFMEIKSNSDFVSCLPTIAEGTVQASVTDTVPL